MIDPTTLNRQGNDVGTSYRSEIFYVSEAQRDEALRIIDDVNASGLVRSLPSRQEALSSVGRRISHAADRRPMSSKGWIVRRRAFLFTLPLIPAALSACTAGADEQTATSEAAGRFEVTRTKEEWRKILTPQQFRVLREHDTERPGSSPLNDEHRAGTYHCAGCDLALYSSETKFESGTGWPSFTAPLPNAIGTSIDRSLFAIRTEVHCRRCGGHLGHVFDDGPPPTGKRYCMNGAAMIFKPKGA